LVRIQSWILKSLRFAFSFFGFIAIIIIIKKLPVYPDEEQWLYVNSRQIVDGTMQYLFPVCSQGFQITQPYIWAPIRLVESFLYSHLGLINHIRVIGVIQAGILIIVLRKFLQIFARNFEIARIVLFALFLLGLLPFLVLLNRPEQPLLILFLCSLIASYRIKESSEKYVGIINYLWLALLILSMPAIHAKGSLFATVGVAFFLILNFYRKKILSMTLIIIGTYSITISMGVWSKRTDCPESAFLTQIFSDISINPTRLDLSSIWKIAGNIARTPKYIFHLFYQNQYQSDWLAQRNSVSFAFQFLANSAVVLALVFITYLLLLHLKKIRFEKQARKESDYLIFLFIMTIVALAVLQRTKNFYDSYLPAVMFALVGVLTIPESMNVKLKRLVSGSLVLVLFTAPAFMQTVSALPSPKSDSKEILRLKLINECGITKEQLSEGGFILDGSLIPLFWSTPRIIYSDYIWGWWGQDVNDLELITRLNPSVILVKNDGTITKSNNDVVIGDYICRNITFYPVE